MANAGHEGREAALQDDPIRLIAKAVMDLTLFTEDLQTRVAALEKNGAAMSALGAEVDGGVIAQVHHLTQLVNGLAQKTGYVHRDRAGA